LFLVSEIYTVITKRGSQSVGWVSSITEITGRSKESELSKAIKLARNMCSRLTVTLKDNSFRV